MYGGGLLSERFQDSYALWDIEAGVDGVACFDCIVGVDVEVCIARVAVVTCVS